MDPRIVWLWATVKLGGSKFNVPAFDEWYPGDSPPPVEKVVKEGDRFVHLEVDQGNDEYVPLPMLAHLEAGDRLWEQQRDYVLRVGTALLEVAREHGIKLDGGGDLPEELEYGVRIHATYPDYQVVKVSFYYSILEGDLMGPSGDLWLPVDGSIQVLKGAFADHLKAHPLVNFESIEEEE